ncbi:MAG TPA: DUF3450 domain-containing protein, partial [Gammaproteobacteria bacterium]
MTLKSCYSKSDTRLRISFASLAGIIVSALLFGSAYAAEVDTLIDVSRSKLKVAQASQERIDQLNDERRALYNEYKAVIKEIEGLKIYNQQLNKQILNQRTEMERIKTTIENVAVTQRQIVPLMLRMIEGLKQFVALDMPFLKDERESRVARLEQLMDDSNISIAEKFRAVIQAYQIENEYGNTIEAYSGIRNIEGVDLKVNILRVGRISMAYQTPDGKYTGYWDKNANGWVETTSSADRSNISQGIRIA